MKNILLFALVFSGISQAASLTKIRESALRCPEAMSTVKLLHNQDRFLVSDDKGLHEIENCWLDSDLRKLAKNPTALEKFQECGYISVDQCSDGQYILKSHVRGLGGGPTLGIAVFWGVKSALYAAIGSAVAATAVGTAVATGGIAPAVLPAVISTASAGIGAAAGAGAGAAVGTVVGTVAAPTVLMTTSGAAMLGSAAGMGGSGAFASLFALEAMITAVATAAGLACGMAPTP